MSDWQSWRPSTNVVDQRGNMAQMLLQIAGQQNGAVPNQPPVHPMDWPWYGPAPRTGPDGPPAQMSIPQQMQAAPFNDSIGALLGWQK